MALIQTGQGSNLCPYIPSGSACDLHVSSCQPPSTRIPWPLCAFAHCCRDNGRWQGDGGCRDLVFGRRHLLPWRSSRGTAAASDVCVSGHLIGPIPGLSIPANATGGNGFPESGNLRPEECRKGIHRGRDGIKQPISEHLFSQEHLRE